MADPVNWSKRFPLDGSTPGGLVVQKDGVEIGRRAILNFIDGSGTDLTITDNSTDTKINIRLDNSILNNLAATRDPVVDDDINDGYSPGSLWVYSAANRIFVCAQNTLNAASWLLLATSTGGVVITAHNELTGLTTGDDHTQYLNNTRGDLRYLQLNTKLDDLATPDNNTDLDASVSRHGLLPRLSGNVADSLRGDGTWVAGAGGSAVNLDGLDDVIITAPVINNTLIFNGTHFVNAPAGTSFSFSVSSFTSNQAGVQLIGPVLNTWLAIGAIIFTASYSNGPATNGTINIVAGHGVWPSALTLGGGGFTGPTPNNTIVNYPSGPNVSITFRVSASKGAVNATRDLSVYFNNHVFYGVSTKASGYNETDVKNLSNTILLTSNTRARNLIVTAGIGEYIIYAFPSRLGLATFTYQGLVGGFMAPELISLTNAAGYQETFYVYRSVQANLGTFTSSDPIIVS